MAAVNGSGQNGRDADANANHRQAILFAKAGEYGQALALFQAAADAAPNDLAARTDLAVCHERLGNIPQAAQLYAAVLDIDATHPQAALNYCNLLFATGESFLGAKIAHRMLGLPEKALPPHTRSQFMNTLGQFCMLAGQAEQAFELFSSATRHLRTAQVFTNLGAACLATERFAAAYGHLRQAVQLDPTLHEAWINLGDAAQERKETHFARSCYVAAQRLRQDGRIALRLLSADLSLAYRQLQGQSVCLQRYSEEFTAPLWKFQCDIPLMRRLNRWARSPVSAAALRDRLRTSCAMPLYRQSMIEWVVRANTAQSPDEIIGIAGLGDIWSEHRRADFHLGIIGAQRHPAAALEASLLVLDFAFNKLQLNKLVSIVYHDNPHSQRSTEALGFHREGLIRQHLYHAETGAYFDVYQNGMLQEDFRNNARLARLSERLIGRDVTRPAGP
ncbi:MAG TPA: GNAT family N-acetyltransferase [Prosthecobacter sp.]